MAILESVTPLVEQLVDRRGVPRRRRRAPAARNRRPRSRRSIRSRVLARDRPDAVGRRRHDEVPRQARERSRQTRRAARRRARAPSANSSPRSPSPACGESGRRRCAQLERMAVRTIGDVAALPTNRCSTAALGPSLGTHLHALATQRRSARASSPTAKRSRSVPRRRTRVDLHGRAACDRELVRLADRVSARLRRAELVRAHRHVEDPLRRLRDAHACPHDPGRDRRQHGDRRDRPRAPRASSTARARGSPARGVAVAARCRARSTQSVLDSRRAGTDEQQRTRAPRRGRARGRRGPRSVRLAGGRPGDRSSTAQRSTSSDQDRARRLRAHRHRARVRASSSSSDARAGRRALDRDLRHRSEARSAQRGPRTTAASRPRRPRRSSSTRSTSCGSARGRRRTSKPSRPRPTRGRRCSARSRSAPDLATCGAGGGGARTRAAPGRAGAALRSPVFAERGADASSSRRVRPAAGGGPPRRPVLPDPGLLRLDVAQGRRPRRAAARSSSTRSTTSTCCAGCSVTRSR